MKRQIVVIHGGNIFKTEKAYLRFLKKKKADLDRICGVRTDWKNSLRRGLGKKYEVVLPLMPNASNANYLEWKIWFEKLIPFLRSGVILVGHSLGGIFLAKYLSENKFRKKISALILIAAPYDDNQLRNFRFRKTAKQFVGLEAKVKKVILYHSKDDPVVPFSHLKKYKEGIEGSIVRVFKNKQHFNQAKFPEIIKDIKKVN